MAADWLSNCQAPVVLKCVQKVDSEFAMLLSCCPAQLFVKVSTVEPFLHTWFHAMGDTQALLMYNFITSRCRWSWRGPVICTRIMCKWIGFGKLLYQRHGKAGGCERVKEFINKTWRRFKKRRVKTIRRSLTISEEILETVLVGPCMFSHKLHGCGHK